MRTVSAGQLPKWFSLSKYPTTNTMDLSEWYENLIWRSNFLVFFCDELEQHRELIESYFDEKEGRKLVWTTTSGARRDSSPGLRAKPSENSLNTTTVSSMTVGTVASFIATSCYDDSGLGRQLSKAVSVVQAETNAVVDIEKGDAAPDFLDQVIAFRKKQQEAAAAVGLGEPFDLLERRELSLINDGTLHVEVDLSVSDELVLADFKSWLRAARKEFKMPARSEFSAAATQRWVTGRVLPYLDLTLWAALENVTIPEEIMQHALYGDDSIPDGKVPRTTKKNADQLIHPLVLQKMLVQIENRIEKPSK